MPHVIIEHTAALAHAITQSQADRRIHLAVVDSGLFSPEAVKTRLVSYDQALCGTEAESVNFVHVTVRILSGRTREQRQLLSQAVFTVLTDALPEVDKRSVDIHEMDQTTYMKG